MSHSSLASTCVRAFLLGLLIVTLATPAGGQESWQEVTVPDVWKKMPAGEDGYSWYRTWVTIPASWEDNELTVFVEPVDDARQVFLNGHHVGGNGSFPPNFRSGLGAAARHQVAAKLVEFGKPNLFAIRVYNTHGRSGFNVAAPVLFARDEAIRLAGTWQFRAGDQPEWSDRQTLPPEEKYLASRVEDAEHVEATLRQLPNDAGPQRVADALKLFNVADDLVIEAVLSEPAIGQPLDFKFDERGRLWVMNYKQYPNPAGLKPVSRDKYLRTVYDKVPPPPPHHYPGNDEITIHEDTDGDGVFDHHKTFLKGLSLATSFARGRGGVFVLNPPYLLFYPDRDQDDVPDGDPEVLLEGFGIEDSHSVANNLRWGPDGWLYAAQGSTVTGQIKRYGSDDKPIHSMGQLIWRYHPVQHKYEIFAEGGGNAFGVEFDAKGRVFSGHNGGDTRGFHYVQGGYYQKGFGKHGELSNPYAYGYFPMMAHHSVPRFTHSFIIYEGGAIPDYEGRLLGVGPLQSHVIASDMTPLGATFVTKDIGTVLTSQDPWFRPVQIHSGPDGAIYVADFYEQRIDHASHYQGRVTPETGRIYRLRLPDAAEGEAFDYHRMSATELIGLLAHSNKWHRQAAQRLLADRSDADVTALVWDLLQEQSGQIALEALWTLHQRDGLDDEAARTLLAHADPHVRAWTIRLICDDGFISEDLAEQLRHLAEDEPHIEARCQLACSVRRLPTDQALPILARQLARTDQDDPFLPLLLWWNLEDQADRDRQAVLDLFADDSFWNLPLVRDHMIERLMRRYAQSGGRADLLSCARLLKKAPEALHVEKLLSGFEQAYQGRSLDGLPEELLAALAQVGGGSLALQVRREDPAAVQKALRLIGDPQHDVQERAELVRIFGQIGDPQVIEPILQLLEEEAQPAVRSAAYVALQAFDDNAIADAALRQHAKVSVDEREQIQGLLASRTGWGRRLVQAVATKSVDPAEVKAATVQRLLFHKDPELTGEVQRIWPDLGSASSEEQREAVARYQGLLVEAAGNPYRGKPLFLEHCGKCHQLFTDGGKIGPDLTSYKRDDLRGILLHVINPSLEIREGFENYVVFMNDGRTLNGFVEDQDNRVVVLKTAEGQRHVLRRDEIEDLQAVRQSIMPEGLLKPLSAQQVRDLFAYLRASQPLP